LDVLFVSKPVTVNGITAPLTSTTYYHSFLLRMTNSAPTLQYISSGNPFSEIATYTTTVVPNGNTASLSIGFNAQDDDSGLGLVTAIVEVSQGPAGGSPQLAVLDSASDVVFSADKKSFRYTATITAVSNVLSTLSFSASDIEGNYTVQISVNDNGNSGACTLDNTNPCDRLGLATVFVIVSKSKGVPAGAIAGAVGAAAAAAAIASIVAWKKLRTPPTEDYNPWSLDDSSEGAVLNPVFESAGRSGDNPLFENVN